MNILLDILLLIILNFINENSNIKYLKSEANICKIESLKMSPWLKCS